MSHPNTSHGLPSADGRSQRAITDEQARAFERDGLLLIRNLLCAEELAALRRETAEMVERAAAEQPDDPWVKDVVYRQHEITAQRVPSRVEYVVDKSPACRALLGHPFILRSVEKLQGREFIPTWDSMVFKLAGQGAEIAWHRDAGREHVGHAPIFNVDFYLDESDLTNCLWAIPGSNSWSAADAAARIEALSKPAFRTQGATPVCMQPGDVLLHDILLLHGSPAATSQLRRLIYYEFRPSETIRALGPHRPEYIPLKQLVLHECLVHRGRQPYAATEEAFAYAGKPPQRGPLTTLRIPHTDFM
jgi:ectoine hydroxylase-related dioxygenase (phytanoyl-CoA dioxygenase family)